jgi:hypothetical protein
MSAKRAMLHFLNRPGLVNPSEHVPFTYALVVDRGAWPAAAYLEDGHAPSNTAYGFVARRA